jgi:hypothetical protein
VIAVHIGIPKYFLGIFVDFSVAIIVDVVTNLRIIRVAPEVGVVAVAPASHAPGFVFVAASRARDAVEVVVQIPEGIRIAVFVMTGIID